MLLDCDRIATKNEQIKYESKNVKENETFNNIMDDLKDLGILK